MKRAVTMLFLLLIVLVMLPNTVLAGAETEPSLVEILGTLGFTNIQEATFETFIPGTYDVTLYAEFADYHDRNELSWYKCGTSEYGVVFYGYEGNYGYTDPPIYDSFTVDVELGMSFISPDARYFTETGRNPDGLKHAKIYKNLDEPEMFFVGFENHFGGGDQDYNDMVFSLRLFRPKAVSAGVNCYHMTYGNDRVVVVLFGGYAYKTPPKVWVNNIYASAEYSKPKMRFLFGLLENGFDVLTPKDGAFYRANDVWVRDAAQWSKNQGYDHVFLFGFSAGGIVVAHDIQKDHATILFSGAVFASAPVNWDSWSNDPIFQSAETAYKDKVSTCFIEGVTDQFYNQMELYYNNALIHKRWYDWNNGHSPFNYTSYDNPAVTVTVACVNWYNAEHPPNTPLAPSGPAIAYKNFPSEFSTSTIDPNGNNVRYQFDWGDGTYTTTSFYASGATASASKTWNSVGIYYVKVRAQDTNGLWSDASPTVAVNVTILYIRLVIHVNAAPPEGVEIRVDEVAYRAYLYTSVTVSVAAGYHTIEAERGFIKEEWMPGTYYVYTFYKWSDGPKDNPRTIYLTSNTTLMAVYLRSRGGFSPW